ncbi:hypothetical protein QVD17_36182 [Tagetes erecta]|uniref:SWIM-type domain-containing protein n=1 Tax=Tagetes erecta TaxID=13708 RepID=A0AAD8NIW0_TARER|nr:hypothetical protein QVD17_36182 [Tagetes erecta]
MSSFHVTQWEVRGKSRPDGLDLYDIYSQDPTWFTIQLFHGGQFLNLGCPDVRYVNGKENYIDLVDASEFSIYALGQMFRTLGYSDDELVEYWYKTPGLDLEGDFRPILSDNDITTLCGYVESVKLVEIYVHHVGGNSEFVDKENIVEEVVVEMGDNRRSFSNNEQAQVEEEIESEDSDGFEVDPDGFDSLSDDENDPPLKSTLKKLRKKNAKAIQQSGCPFYLGQSILEKKQIKRLVTSYAVKTRRQLYVLKNDRFRFRVICMGKHPHSCVNVPGETGNLSEGEKCFDGLSDVEICGSHEGESNKEDECALNKEKLPQPTCPWVLYFSRKKESELFVVKTLVDQHHCLQTRDVNLYTISFIAREIEPIIQSNPTIPLRALQDQIQRKHQLQVSLNKAFRAKMKALKKLEGDFNEQYGILRDYCEELMRSNPGTTIKIAVEREFNPSSPSRQFKRIYICLGPLKAGFKKCGREILGLDGCFMKGPYPGQVLTAVGVDGNNGIYPVSYALVESENTSSWTWFLECLRDDLDLDLNSNFTFITDRQKGLLPSLETVFPNAEHRFCVRHIHENMKSQWRGQQFKDMLWRAATATTIPQFNKRMEEIKKQDSSLHTWLSQIPAKSWARSHFTGRAKCDVLLNNWCEVFNKQLVDARDKPIITCLEFIREYLMKRIVKVQSLIDKPKTQEYPLTPFVRNQLDEIKKCAAEYNVVMAGGNKYQVSGPWLDQCVVDVQTKTCSCRKWELTGIPCKHAVAVNWNMGSNAMNVGLPESWVSDVYRLSTWQEVYKHTIVPICGVELWTPSNCPTTLLPPKHHIQVGRPKKKRRKTQDEMMSKVPLEGKLTRYGHMKHCSKCKNAGHNSRSCKGQGGQGDGFSGKGGQGHWNGGQAHGFGGQGQGTQTTQPTTQNAPQATQATQATQGSQTRYGQRCSKCKGQGHNARSCKF